MVSHENAADWTPLPVPLAVQAADRIPKQRYYDPDFYALENELLWPGTLVQAFLKLRSEEAVTVPSAAVQVSQTGNFVYVIKNEKAELHPVKVARTLGEITVLESGVNAGDSVVVDGHLQLTDGARVVIRPAKKASS